MIAVAGAKGGVGCSTVALHVASPPPATTLIARCAGRARPADRRPASLLDLQSHRSIADLASVAEGEVTVRSLDDTLYVHSTGLRVLLAPERGEDGEDIGASAARQILGALKVPAATSSSADVGSVMTEAGAVAVEMASNVLIVTHARRAGHPRGHRLLRRGSAWDRSTRPRASCSTAPAASTRSSPTSRAACCRRPSSTRRCHRGSATSRSRWNTGPPRAPGAGVDPPRAGRRWRWRSKPSRRRAAAGACGCAARRAPRPAQTTIEMLGMLPIVLIVVLGLIQMLFVGYTWMQTSQAARAGARAWAVDDNRAWWTGAAKGPAAQELARRRQGLRAQGRRRHRHRPRAAVLPLPHGLRDGLRSRVQELDGRAMRRRGSERGQASIELLLMLPAILLLGLVVWQVHLTLTVANDAENAARTAARKGAAPRPRARRWSPSTATTSRRARRARPSAASRSRGAP